MGQDGFPDGGATPASDPPPHWRGASLLEEWEGMALVPPSCRTVFLYFFSKAKCLLPRAGFVCLLETAVVKSWEQASMSKIAAL